MARRADCCAPGGAVAREGAEHWHVGDLEGGGADQSDANVVKEAHRFHREELLKHVHEAGRHNPRYVAAIERLLDSLGGKAVPSSAPGGVIPGIGVICELV